MRVLQVNAVYGIASTGRSARELHDWLTEHGHECVTFYGNQPREFPETEARFMGSTFTHKLHALTARLTGEAGIGSWAVTKKLIAFIREYKPDVVHLRNLHGNFVHIPMLMRFLAQEDIPTVIQTDDCYYFTGGCMHYTTNGCSGFTRDCSNCRHLRRGQDYVFANRAKRNLLRKREMFAAMRRIAVVGVSQWTAREAARSAVFHGAPIIDYVYNWIDLDVFAPRTADTNAATRASLGIAPDEKMLLGVASGWSNKKGLGDFAALRRELPREYKIVLVGNMDGGVSLPKGIIHVAATESVVKLADLYSAADVFVHLSREETFGKVTAEALACGTPAVVYDSTASPELVDAQTGRVVAPSNIQAAAEAIAELAATDCAKARRARAATLFDLDTNCKKILDLYSKVINLRIP